VPLACGAEPGVGVGPVSADGLTWADGPA
jgi:hypothetical protein